MWFCERRCSWIVEERTYIQLWKDCVGMCISQELQLLPSFVFLFLPSPIFMFTLGSWRQLLCCTLALCILQYNPSKIFQLHSSENCGSVYYGTFFSIVMLIYSKYGLSFTLNESYYFSDPESLFQLNWFNPLIYFFILLRWFVTKQIISVGAKTSLFSMLASSNSC